MQPFKSIRGFGPGVIAGLLTLAGLPTATSAQTLARIQQAAAINLGFVPDLSPFSSRSPDGRPRGYAVELCQYVAGVLEGRLGLPNLAQNDIAVSAADGLNMLERGEIDLFCGPVSETLKTRERVSFSIPIYVSGIGALVRKDAPASLLRVLNGEVAHTGPKWRATVNAGLANHVYAVQAGSTSEAWVRERIAMLGVIAKVVTVDAYEKGIEMVARKRADAYFADRAVLATRIAQSENGADLQVLDRRFTLEPMALAVLRGDEDFRLVVDAALSELYRSDGYAPTYSRYFGKPTDTALLLFKAYALP